MDRIKDLQVFGERAPNHVLINEYTAGQGIMVNTRIRTRFILVEKYMQYPLLKYCTIILQAHTDGPLFYPVVSTISCGSHVLLQFQPANADVSHGVSR
jgi:alkylated DNA repair protein alkB family protein 6